MRLEWNNANHAVHYFSGFRVACFTEAAPSLCSTNTAAIVSISTMTITRKTIFRSTFVFDFGSKLCDPASA